MKNPTRFWAIIEPVSFASIVTGQLAAVLFFTKSNATRELRKMRKHKNVRAKELKLLRVTVTP